MSSVAANRDLEILDRNQLGVGTGSENLVGGGGDL